MKLKSLVAIIAFLALQISVHAQIKFEGSHDEGVQSILLDKGEIKYATYDKDKKAIVLYSSDFTQWKTVSLDLPRGLHFDELKSISKDVFNDDALIELAFTCVEYRSSNELEATTNYVDVLSTIYVINEEGTMVLELKDSNDLKIVDSNGTRKLWVYKQGRQDSDRSDNIDVYSLPDYHNTHMQNTQRDEYKYDTFGDRRGM